MRLAPLGAASWPALQESEPFLRWGVDLGSPPEVWLSSPESALVAISRRRRTAGPRSLLFIRRRSRPRSEPDAVASELAEMAAALIPEVSAGGLTVPRDLALPVYQALTPVLPPGDPAGPVEGVGWDWMWTTQRLAVAIRSRAEGVGAAAGVQMVALNAAEPSVAAQIQDLLDAASPRHSARPGDPRVRQWYGLCTPAGELAGCAAWYEAVPGIPLLASLAVRADHRRAGLALALMVQISQAAFDAGCPAVTVDLYADNAVARRLYESLGFALEQEFASWELSDGRAPPA